ncbi:hypothetical protein Lal_00041740, partial [Lupinus albus]
MLDLNTSDAILTQNKIMTQQIEALTKQIETCLSILSDSRPGEKFSLKREGTKSSWKPRLIERFSPERERITWEGEILGYTGGFSPERELSRLGKKWQFWAIDTVRFCFFNSVIDYTIL